jgi:major type 1 subunit fimbrin (pilin)
MQSHRTAPRHLAIAASACLALGAASSASAANVILFAGQLTDATCEVEGIDKAGAADFSIALPVISATQLDALDSTAGHTRFGLQLKNCSAVTNGVQAFFEGGPHLDSATNSLLPNNGGPIHFALYNEVGGRIRIGNTSQKLGPSYAADTRMYFDVAYVRARPGPVTAGTFEGLVTYSLNYL